jgi:protein-S-isoprenylcysteine O-methyltransferase Ste14
LTGRHGNPHFSALHFLSFGFIFAGFALLSKAWHVLYHAQRLHQLARTGPYRLVRHPQYIGFVAIMFGFLLQWPTLLTLAMFPVLLVMYIRLGIAEERDSEMAFGQAWRDYAAVTPRFIPNWFRSGRERSVDYR